MPYDEWTSFEHVPVLLDAAISYLNPRDGGIYVDGTLGGGGHSEAILVRSSPNGRVIGIDQDESALAAARRRLARFEGRVEFIHDNFANLTQVMQRLSIERVDGILLDFGVSSPQLDDPTRGFTYQADAPLDMRMNRRAVTDAATLVNTLSAAELAEIIRKYGEERWAWRIAEHIVREREKEPILTTGRLADVIKGAIPAAARRRGPHPARRTFQALRIAVNRELEAIEAVLPQAVQLLRPGGRIVVISFHSLEDRIVKNYFRQAASPCQCPPELPVCQCDRSPSLRILTRQPVVADEAEVERNPRSRSARLRAAERVLLLGESE